MAREFVERLGGEGGDREGYARVRSVARSGSSEIFACPIKCAENYFHRSSRFSLFLSFLLAARLSVLHVLQTSFDASVRSANRWIRFGSNASVVATISPQHSRVVATARFNGSSLKLC